MAEKTELEVLQDISKKMDDSKELQTKEITNLRDEAKNMAAKYEAEIKQLQEDLVAKGATIGEIVNEVKELKAKGGRIKSGESKIRSLGSLIYETIEEHKDDFGMLQDGHAFKPVKIETKTVANISSANITGDSYQQYMPWQQGMEPVGQTRFRDIFSTVPSAVDHIQYPRAKSPVGEGSFGRQATEGATKAQVDRDHEMISLTLKPMSGFTVVSRQSLRNIVFLQSWLPTSLMESLMDSEDTDFANTLVAAATGSTTTTQTLAASKLITYIKNLRKNKHQANAIMIDPDVWETILNYRAAEVRDFSQVVTVDANGNVRILGRSVYDVNWLTGGRVVVGDTRKAAIVQSEGLTLRQSDSHASIFTSNETAFLLERTEGLMINRPDAFVSALIS